MPSRKRFLSWKPAKQKRYLAHHGKPQPQTDPNPLDFQQPLSRQAARQEILGAVKMKYGAQEQGLREQGRVSDYMSGTTIPGYFAQYQQAVAQAGERQRAAQAQAQATVTAQQQAAAAADLNQNIQLAQQDQASAQQRGATVSPENNQRAVQSSAARQNLGNIFGAQLATQGANQASYLADKGRIGKGAEIDALLKERQNKGKVQTALGTLQGEKGAYGQQVRGDLRDAERKYALEQLVFTNPSANAQLGAETTQKGQKQTAANARAGRRSTARNQRANRNATFLGAHGVTLPQYQAMSPGQRIASDKKHAAALRKPGSGTNADGTGETFTPSQKGRAGAQFRKYLHDNDVTVKEVKAHKRDIIDILTTTYKINNTLAHREVNKWLKEHLKPVPGSPGRLKTHPK